MAARDKTPNRTLSVAISRKCGKCDNHGAISRTKEDGTIEVRCLEHLSPKVDLLSEFLKVL